MVPIIAIVFAIILLAISTPIFLVFGVGSIAYGLHELQLPAPTLMQVSIQAITKHMLLAIPLFILSGLLMVKGGAAKRDCGAASAPGALPAADSPNGLRNTLEWTFELDAGGGPSRSRSQAQSRATRWWGPSTWADMAGGTGPPIGWSSCG